MIDHEIRKKQHNKILQTTDNKRKNIIHKIGTVLADMKIQTESRER